MISYVISCYMIVYVLYQMSCYIMLYYLVTEPKAEGARPLHSLLRSYCFYVMNSIFERIREILRQQGFRTARRSNHLLGVAGRRVSVRTSRIMWVGIHLPARARKRGHVCLRARACRDCARSGSSNYMGCS